MKRTSSTCLLALAFFLAPCAFLLTPCFAQDGNPRHPGVSHFEKIGMMHGSGIGALPDLNGDNIRDFVIGRSGELWLYYGQVGGLPDEASGVRLGPTEINADTRILAIGDWDGMNGPDLCTRIQLDGDTSFGNTELLYTVSRTVVFWNNGGGYFSIDDTTHLSPGIVASFNAGSGVSPDLNKDGVSDLFTYGSGGGVQDGGSVKFPRSFIYLGHQGGCWSRDGIPNNPDWGWWNAPNTPRLDAQDLDQDGATDLILYNDLQGGSRPLSVLYGGSEGALPDTLTDLQQIDMAPYGGRGVVFSDVSGDGIPDLNIVNIDDDLVRIYVGCKGQRLLEQFGTGNDPPQGERWWGKPWAAVQGPNHVSDAWFGFTTALYDLGSADTNESAEIWVVSVPSLLCYDVGGRLLDGVQYGLDSLFDGEIELRLSDAKRLGDIDGSGRATLTLVGEGGIHFYHTVDALPEPMASFWRVPQCDSVSSVTSDQFQVGNELALTVVPNPASRQVRIAWRSGEAGKRGSGEATITVHDLLGQEVTAFTVAAREGEAVWDASKTFDGRYFITVTVNNTSETIGVVLR